MLAALEMGLDTDIQIESLDTAEGRTFREIRNRDGLKAALAWRNARFADGRSDAHPPAFFPLPLRADRPAL